MVGGGGVGADGSELQSPWQPVDLRGPKEGVFIVQQRMQKMRERVGKEGGRP